MTCPHGVSTARADIWWNREEERAKQGPRPHTSTCSCCAGPFLALPDFPAERCSHCQDGTAQQYELVP